MTKKIIFLHLEIFFPPKRKMGAMFANNWLKTPTNSWLKELFGLLNIINAIFCAD